MKDLMNSKVIWTMETLLDGEAQAPFTATMIPENDQGRIRLEMSIDERATGFVLSSLDALREAIIGRETHGVKVPRSYKPLDLSDLDLPEDMPKSAREAIAAMLGGLREKMGDNPPRVEVVNAGEDPELLAKLIKDASEGKGKMFDMSGEEVSPDAAKNMIRKAVNRIMGKALANPPEALKGAIASFLEDSGIVRHADFEEYQLHQHNDGSVCCAVDGEKQEDALPILQSLARRFGIAVNTDSGARRTEEDLGKEVIDFFSEIPTNKAGLH